MRASWILALAASTCMRPAAGASLTLGSLFDSDEGVAWRASGIVAPMPHWLVGAGASRHRMQFDGERYSGTSLGASTRASFGGFFAGVSGQRWKDSGEARSNSLHAEAGWTSASGVTVGVLFTDRRLRAPFTSTDLAGQTLAHEVRSDGEGVGASLAWTSRNWSVSARFLDYRYRHRQQGEVTALVSVPGLLDELDSIGGDLSAIDPATPVLQLLEGAGLLGPVQTLLDTVGATAGAVLPPVVGLADDLIEGLPLPLPTLGELLDLGLFGRMQQLGASPLTLVAGLPDREWALGVERQFPRAWLRLDWVRQRDALAHDDVDVASLTLGYRISDRFSVDTTAGMADGGPQGRLGYGGVSLTLRNGPQGR